MTERSGTITDPIWADIVIGFFAVFAVMALFAVVEALVHAVVRRWRESDAELDLLVTDELQQIDADRQAADR